MSKTKNTPLEKRLLRMLKKAITQIQEMEHHNKIMARALSVRSEK